MVFFSTLRQEPRKITTLRQIANILTDETFSGEAYYNVTSERSLLIEGIPTLIIGWERVKKEFPEASIIEWHIVDNVYWTYGKYERREKYEENLTKFEKLIFKQLMESIIYTYFDVILEGDRRFSKFVSFLEDPREKVAYVSRDMLYVYPEGTKHVYGISLRDCDYLDDGYKKRVFSAIYGKENIRLVKNNEEDIRKLRYKIKNSAYILAYLL